MIARSIILCSLIVGCAAPAAAPVVTAVGGASSAGVTAVVATDLAGAESGTVLSMSRKAYAVPPTIALDNTT